MRDICKCPTFYLEFSAVVSVFINLDSTTKKHSKKTNDDIYSEPVSGLLPLLLCLILPWVQIKLSDINNLERVKRFPTGLRHPPFRVRAGPLHADPSPFFPNHLGLRGHPCKELQNPSVFGKGLLLIELSVFLPS